MTPPPEIRSHHVDNCNGLRMHVLECAPVGPARGTLLLLHGFPELAFSWRRVMPPFAAAGWRVVAPDQRGYGATTGWSEGFDVDLTEFAFPNLVVDALGLLAALAIERVDAVIGHDFGSPVAACCALMRPDVFASLVMMSAPFAGVPVLSTEASAASALNADVNSALGLLERPRKHYQWYYSTREANADMCAPSMGLGPFLRAYFHVKSADWSGNRPYRLEGPSAEVLAALPDYYIMPLGADMPAAVAPFAPRPNASCEWLPDSALGSYVEAYDATGFQGGLNWYRCVTSGRNGQALKLYSGRRIEVPACFVAGASDWGIYQKPGDIEAMASTACADFRGNTLVEGAGHWVQQEQPEAVVAAIDAFLSGAVTGH